MSDDNEAQKQWDNLLKKFPEANFLQSPLWAKTNDLIGHNFVFTNYDNEAVSLCIIKNAKRGRYLEVPGGPLLNWGDKKRLKEVFDKIIDIAKYYKCVFIRFRPQLKNIEENRQHINYLKKFYPIHPAPMHLHAQNTVILNLEKSEEELLADLRRQTRYEVRRADKLGLKVIENSNKEAVEEFHKIQLETAHRQNFVPPSEKELLAEREAFSPNNLKLYKVIDKDNQPVAYGLILIYGDEAEYFEAASTELNRKLPGAYALLWQAIKDLKNLGVKRFNLWGIAPPNSPNHRYAGVTTFKTGFGGEIIEFIPAQDIVVNKLKYQLNVLVEETRKKKRNL